jgi:hypothetical protein
MGRKILKIVGISLSILVLALLFVVEPVDRTPYQQMPYYRETKAQLQQLSERPRPQATAALRAGWAKTNLTPPFPTPTAGYGGRDGKLYESVLDSVYARALVLDNGALRFAIVSLDLLIIHPTVTAQLEEELPRIGFSLDNTYLAATHSHNSLGGWGKRLAGKLFAGTYDQRVVDHIVQSVIAAIDRAQQQLMPAQVGFAQLHVPELVQNRLVGDQGTTDPFVRMLKFRKNTGETALLFTYTAHPTILEMGRLQLSRDYPGALVDALEKKDRVSVDFAMFMAGAVGSQGPVEKGSDLEAMHHMASELDRHIETKLACIPLQPDTTLPLHMLRVPLRLREPHRRITENWRLRPWVFNLIYGHYPSEMKALRIGQQVLVGVPGDFSGELVADFEAISQQKGINLMITSFNGGYVGYITPDAYYYLPEYETLHMNWYGPYNAAYFEEVMKALIRMI